MKKAAPVDEKARQAVEDTFRAAQNHRRSGNLAAAEPLYKNILKTDPKHSGAAYYLALVLMRQQRFDEALPLFTRVLPHTSQPEEVEINIALALHGIGKSSEAVSHLKSALRHKPGFAPALTVMGVIAKDRQNFDEAERHFRDAIEADAKFPQPRYNYAAMLEGLNRLDEAQQVAEQALALAPSDLGIRLINAKILRRRKQYEPALALLEKTDPSAHPLAVRYYAELGQLYDGLNRPAEAFESFGQANRLHQSANPIIAGAGRNVFSGRIKNYREVVRPEWIKSWTPALAGSRTQEPVFIIGFPRSGTTLLDQILTAQGDFTVAEECSALADLIKRIDKEHGGFPACLAGLRADEITALQKRYVSDLKKLGKLKDGKRLVDRMPLHVINIPLIHRLFPHAKIIFALRHPCDAVLSCYMQEFESNPGMINFLDLNDAAAMYDDTMAAWEVYRESFPLDYHIARYEKVVSSFREEITALLDFLGADWNDSVLEFDRVARERGKISTPSYSQVTQKIYTDSAGRWLRYEDQLSPVLDKLLPWADKFGYGAETMPATTGAVGGRGS